MEVTKKITRALREFEEVKGFFMVSYENSFLWEFSLIVELMTWDSLSKSVPPAPDAFPTCTSRSKIVFSTEPSTHTWQKNGKGIVPGNKCIFDVLSRYSQIYPFRKYKNVFMHSTLEPQALTSYFKVGRNEIDVPHSCKIPKIGELEWIRAQCWERPRESFISAATVIERLQISI